MNSFKKSVFLLSVSLLLFCVSCTSFDNSLNNENVLQTASQEQSGESCIENTYQNVIEETILCLTSSEYQGRLTGSQGNASAANYIVTILEDTGFSPLIDDCYKTDYYTTVPQYESASFALQTGNEEIMLESGVDFYPYIMSTTLVSGTLLQGATDGELYLEENGIVTLIIKEGDFRTSYFKSDTFALATIGVSEDAMMLLKNNIGAIANFELYATTESTNVSNLLAVQRGKSSEMAIVIGAHFDHLGAVEDAVWEGALDNATGVATVLDVAAQLAAYDLPYDVVVALWNGEETGLSGSQAGYQLLEDIYDDYIYINIDTIGALDGTPVGISCNDGADNLCELLLTCMYTEGVENLIYAEQSVGGDHDSFYNRTTISFSLTSLENIHKLSDTASLVDYDALSTFSTALVHSITMYQKEMLSAINPSDNNAESELSEQFENEKSTNIIWPEGDYLALTSAEKIKYQELVALQLQEDEFVLLSDFTVVSGFLQDDSVEGLIEKYSDLIITKNIERYTLLSATISRNDTSTNAYLSPGEIFSYSSDTSCIQSLRLIYQSEEQAVSVTCYKDMKLYSLADSNTVQALSEFSDVYFAQVNGCLCILKEHGNLLLMFSVGEILQLGETEMFLTSSNSEKSDFQEVIEIFLRDSTFDVFF